jgi:hypothetical protein
MLLANMDPPTKSKATIPAAFNNKDSSRVKVATNVENKVIECSILQPE